MRLPKFLEFLRPVFGDDDEVADALKLSGHLHVKVSSPGRSDRVVYDSKNFIVDMGKTAVRNILLGASGGGVAGSIYRMAVGDGGAPAGNLFSPKQPDASWPARTGLFHEVIRQDISSFSAPNAFAARFVGSFSSTDVDVTSFSLSEHVINEAILIAGNGVLTVGGRKAQINKAPPDTIGADEKTLSMRTFPSVPFDPVSNVTVTVTWTITVLT
jgi:hypothetical protein